MTGVETIACYPKVLTLRDGTSVILRPLQRGDEQVLLQFFLSIPEEERFFLKEDVTSPRVLGQWVEQLNYRRALPLLGLVDSEVVADAVLIRSRGNSRSHLGEVRVVVAPAYRGRGLGTALIRDLCDIADDAGLDKVSFEAVADCEEEAIKAAEWLGFIRVASIEGVVRDQQGHPHDLVLLIMPLGKWYQWTKF